VVAAFTAAEPFVTELNRLIAENEEEDDEEEGDAMEVRVCVRFWCLVCFFVVCAWGVFDNRLCAFLFGLTVGSDVHTQTHQTNKQPTNQTHTHIPIQEASDEEEEEEDEEDEEEEG
jgi:hypothetical protein